MKTKIFSFIFVISIFIFACTKDEEVNPLLGEAEIIPLEIGKSYTYRLVAYDQNGQETVDRLSTDVVETDTLIDGEKWYRLKGRVNYSKNKSEGYYSYLTEAKKELFIFKYPAVKGETYESLVYIYNPEADESNKEIQGIRQVTVVSTNATVTSPISGKVFEHCIHYKIPKFTNTNDPNTRIFPSEQYLIPGKGQVLNIDYYNEDFSQIRLVTEQQL